MTHQTQPTAFDEVMELLAEHGFDGMAQAVGVLLNEVMKLERSHALGAAPYHRVIARSSQVVRHQEVTVWRTQEHQSQPLAQ
jgi:hypothetical protein